MKKLFTLFLSLNAAFAFSQAPNLINYQGIARSGNGDPIVTPIALRFEIFNGANSFYSEDQSGVAVNALGLFSTQIGKNGTIPANWTNGTYTLKVSIDTLNGTNFVALGSQQLASVPFALNAPSPTISVTNNTLLTVGTATATLPAQGGLQTLSSTGNSISISGGLSTVTIAPISLTGGGATTVTPNGPYGYSINTASTTLFGGFYNTFTSTAMPSGLLQITGTWPNYSLMVSPAITFSPASGVLYLNSYIGTYPAYSYSYNVTPNLNFSNGVLSSGLNSADLNAYTPWRHGTLTNTAVAVVRLGTNTDKVVIGHPNPPTPVAGTPELLVDGFTKLGDSAPAIQIMTISATTAGGANGSVTVPLPNYNYQTVSTVLLPSKIISVSVLVQDIPGNWVPPGNTILTAANYNWHLASTGVVITNGAAAGNILSAAVKITIMYIP